MVSTHHCSVFLLLLILHLGFQHYKSKNWNDVVRGAEFQQFAYHRILIMLFLELNAPEQVLDSINFQVNL